MQPRPISEQEFNQNFLAYCEGKKEVEAKKQAIQVEKQAIQVQKQAACEIVKNKLDEYVKDLTRIQMDLTFVLLAERKLELNNKLNTVIIEIEKIKNVVNIDMKTENLKKILLIFDHKVQALSNDFEIAKNPFDKYVRDLTRMQTDLIFIPLAEKKLELNNKLNTVIIEIEKIKNVIKVGVEEEKLKKTLLIFEQKVQALANELEMAKNP